MVRKTELHPLYYQAPILIHSTGQKVTVQSMAAVFKHMKVDFDEKIAQIFELPGQEYDDFYLKMA